MGYYAWSGQECKACTGGKYSGGGQNSNNGAGGPNSACVQCGGGWAAPSGAAACHQCGKGQYSGAGWSNCGNCPAGQYQDANGPNSGCKSCSVLGENKYTSSTGSHTCYDCDYRSQRANNRASCARCQDGQYKGSWNCIDCPTGKWWQDTG